MGYYYEQSAIIDYDALSRRKGLKINFAFSEKTSNYNENKQIQLPFTDHVSTKNVTGMFPSA